MNSFITQTTAPNKEAPNLPTSLEQAIKHNNVRGVRGALQQTNAADPETIHEIKTTLIKDNKGNENLCPEIKQELFNYLVKAGCDPYTPIHEGKNLFELTNQTTPPQPYDGIAKTAISAVTAALGAAPFLGFIDRAARETRLRMYNNVSTGMRNQIWRLYKRPAQFIITPLVYRAAFVYSSTFTTSCVVENICENHGKEPRLFKLAGSSVALIMATKAKDLFYPIIADKTRHKGLSTTHNFSSMVVYFTLPKATSDYLVNQRHYSEEKANKIGRFVPFGMQPLLAQIDLLAHDLHSHPNAQFIDRLTRIRPQYAPTILLGMGRAAALGTVTYTYGSLKTWLLAEPKRR